MKQLIVFFCSVALGVCIYGLIAGDQDSSSLSVMNRVWEHNLELRTMAP
ncbi:MAG: hypothetical protein K6F52_01495 [Clostridia bacterium]|nr:hypothetical protein [Clostridia bacterium]